MSDQQHGQEPIRDALPAATAAIYPRERLRMAHRAAVAVVALVEAARVAGNQGRGARR